jgi:uncharacterized membrane protein
MELTINNLIKIILGLLVVVAVIYGVYKVFQNSIIGVFGGIGNSSKLFLCLLK